MQAAGHAYQLLTTHNLDPRGAMLPRGMDPAQTVELHGPAALIEQLATAESMGRQLVDDAVAGRELIWPEDRLAAARVAARIITRAPAADTWPGELAAVAHRTGLDEHALRAAVIDTITADTAMDADALGRLTGRDRRDDLDRGQHVPASAAQLAAISGLRTAPLRPTMWQRADDTRSVLRDVPSSSLGLH